MNTSDILIDAYQRIQGLVHTITDGLDDRAIAYRPGSDANSIGWLIWHLTRVQDDHVSEIADRTQAWVDDGWAERFGMEPDPAETGYGHTSQQVAAVHPAADLLRTYHDAVHARTVEYLSGIDPEELDRIIDDQRDPPVSVGVRLVSVIGDDLQHAGQAAYVRGLLEGIEL